MNSKSNRSYKLRTKQMAIHVRAFGQINKPIVTTKVEEGLFTIDDMMLSAILESTFPTNHSIYRNTYNYYYA